MKTVETPLKLLSNSSLTPPLFFVTGIFAVFDGHGGDAVAQYLQSRYASVFSSAYRHLETHLDFTQIDPESGIYEAAVARAFEETSARIDRSLLEKDYARQQKQQAGALSNAATVSSLVSSSSNEAAFAGSVGVIAVVAPAKVVSAGEGDGSGRRAMQVFISHVGDCRAVLSQDGTCLMMLLSRVYNTCRCIIHCIICVLLSHGCDTGHTLLFLQPIALLLLYCDLMNIAAL